jgi:hypothetical protein
MSLFVPVFFPLFPVLPDGTCGCKIPGCSRTGKHPAVKFGELQAGADEPRRIVVDGVAGGMGIKTGAAPYGSGIIAVDLDSEEAMRVWDSLGEHEPTTVIQTGRALQLYFLHPGFRVSNSKSALGPKIDVRGDGGYVVAPGSAHASGRTYRTVVDAPPAPCPDWLIKWFKSRPARAEVQPSPDDITEPTERTHRRELYRQHLETCPPSIAGRGGDEALFAAVQYGAYDLALPTEDVLELVGEVFDPRCDPPWGPELEERVLHKAHYAKTKSTRDRREPAPALEQAAWDDLFGSTSGTKDPSEKQGGNSVPETTEPGAGTGAPDVDPLPVLWDAWGEVPLPPEFLIDDFLVEHSVSMIYAAPGTIKSWTAISVACAVALGEPWLGERAVSGAGKVVYVDFEDGRYEFHRRVHMLTKGRRVENLGYIYTPGQLRDAELWRKLTALKKRHNVKLFIIDTLAGGSRGVDENATEAAEGLLFAGNLAEMERVSVLFLHHANKSGKERGSTGIPAAVDSLFKLETLSEDEATGEVVAKISCVKSGQKKVRPMTLKLTDERGLERVPEESSGTKDPSEKQGGNSVPEEEEKKTFEQLRSEILLLIEQRGPWASVDAIRGEVKARKAHVQAVVSELLESGQIARSPDGWMRDNEKLRRERLREAIQTHPNATRTKLLALASISRDQFDRYLALGNVRPISPDVSIPGFTWSEQ